MSTMKPYKCYSTNACTKSAWAYITKHGSLDVFIEDAVTGRVLSTKVRADVATKACHKSMSFRAKRKKR